MTRSALKKQIHEAIDSIESQPILKAIQMILDQELKHKKDALKPFTLEEFFARNTQSQKEIKQGALIDRKSIKAKYKIG
jgi:hypothetical protein